MFKKGNDTKMISVANSKNRNNFDKKLFYYARLDNTPLLDELNTNTRSGLSTEFVENWQDEHGYNEISNHNEYVWYMNLLESIFNPFNIILLIIAAISIITKDNIGGMIICFLVLVSSIIKYLQEDKSNKASEKLKTMVKTTATVIRDNVKREVSIEDLIVGDIIYLSAGDIVPADVRLLESKDLFIAQSSLTGEAEPIEKFSKLKNNDHKNVLDLENICFMGTNIVSGTGIAVILSNGNNTYFGSMSKLIAKKKTKTDFDKGLSDVSFFLLKFMIIMVIIVFFINGLMKHNWLEAFLFATSVAVSLTPEMLPVIVSTNLAKGAVLMSRKRTVVKNMNAIQNFGAMDILCSDKTGTLTENIIILQYHLNVKGEEDLKILRYAYLNSNFQTGLKNLLDIAIINKAVENGFYSLNFEYKKIDEIPFDFVRRRMSVVLENKDGEVHIITKGAIEEILQICKYYEYNNEVFELDEKTKQEIVERILKLNRDGMRVLALATKKINKDEKTSVDAENEMTLMGYLSFLDPPKQSAKSAIKALRENNVKIKVLTGDSDVITRYICKQMDINSERILLGSEINNYTDEELIKITRECDIFAKLSPQQKLKIIKTLKQDGHTIGFMGDGINDAPAMKEADVAISVDTAVDIAKESADIILLKKDLNVLADGVIEGRKIFCNIIKYINMTISSNFGNMLSIIVASLLLPFLPMLPVQILVLNILYDVSQISIPWDNVDKELLVKQKKWSARAIRNFMLYIGSVSSICDILLFFIMYKVLHYDQHMFSSCWFVASMLTQIVIINFIRTRKRPFLESSMSPQVMFCTFATAIVTIVLPYITVGSYIGLVKIPAIFYLWLALIVFVYVLLIQIVKKIYTKKYDAWL